MITNNLNLPQPFVNAVTSDYTYKPRRYSVTDILGGTCEAILKRRHHGEQNEDVSDRIWALWGTAVHKVLEESEATDTQLQEQWHSVQIGDYELSGIFDLYDDSTKTVTDWKTTSCWTVILGDFERWRMQTLTYCWMLRKSGFGACKGEVVALLRDHSQRKARTDRDYPRHPVFRIGWDFTDEDFSDIAYHIQAWFAAVKHEEAVEDDLLRPCNPKQRWHKPDRWALMQRGKRRALKLFDSQEEAERYADDKGIDIAKLRHYIDHRPGEDTKCESYCSVSEFCPYARRKKS